MQGWLKALLYFFAFLIVSFAAQFLGATIIKFSLDLNTTELRSTLLQPKYLHWMIVIVGLTFLSILLITWVFMKFIEKKPLQSIGLDIQNRSKDIMLGLILGFLLIAFGFVVLLTLGYLQIEGFSFDPLSTLTFVAILTFVALNEEIVMRGYILSRFMESMNRYIALAISALLFMLMHSMNPNLGLVPVINLFIAGIFLGISYIHTKNLWFPIALHFAWNFSQGPIFGFEVSGLKLQGIIQQEISGNPLITGGEFGLEGSLLVTILISICSVLIHLYYKNKAISHEPQAV